MNPDVDITRQVLVEKAPFEIELIAPNTGWWYGGQEFNGQNFTVTVGGNNLLKKRYGSYVGHIKSGSYIIVSGKYTGMVIAKRDTKRIK